MGGAAIEAGLANARQAAWKRKKERKGQIYHCPYCGGNYYARKMIIANDRVRGICKKCFKDKKALLALRYKPLQPTHLPKY